MVVPSTGNTVVAAGERPPGAGKPYPGGAAARTPVECEVRCDPAGVPRELTCEGRHYTVISPPFRWYERRMCWELDERVPRDSPLNVVDRQRWSVQVTRSAAVAPRTFELLHQEGARRWWVLGERFG